MTAMPWGQKKSRREMIQSQMVAPPLAAIEGTTLRLKTATTKSRTRSRRPRARIRCGWAAGCVVVDNSFANCRPAPGWTPEGGCSHMSTDTARRAGESARPTFAKRLMCDRDRSGAFLLRLRQGSCDVRKRRQVLVDIRFRVLHGNRPLLVPPVRLRHHATVDHAEPVVTPEINVDRFPVAIIANLLRIEHQRSVGSSLCNVSLQANFRDRAAIAVRQFFAELINFGVVLTRQNFAKGCQPRGHRDRVRVIGSTVEDLMLRDQVHHRLAGAKRCQRQASAD